MVAEHDAGAAHLSVLEPGGELASRPGVVERTAVFLHGILGSGGNWRSFARRLQRQVAAHADRPIALRVVLVDLPGHGDAPRPSVITTVDGCAEAVWAALGQGGHGCDVLVGHSFGGKVALSMLAVGPALLPAATWVLDSPPGATMVEPGSRRADVERVIDTLRAVEPPFASREALIARLTAAGLSPPLSRWMTTNVTRRDDADGLWWRFDLDAVEALLDDYRGLDRWPLLDAFSPHADGGRARVHLVRAERSDRWVGEDARRVEALTAGSGAVRAHTLPNAGHWLHVDAPEALLAMLAGEPPLSG